ncbi:hypothetical protein [Ferruginibacter sp.]|nr:hypothetical protein [Ferruginibacter sp.]
MHFFLLDVVEEPWLQRNGRDIIVLTVMALIAIAAIVGIFIWIKKKKKAE